MHLTLYSTRIDLYYSQVHWGWKHSVVEVLGKFNAFLRWKGHVYRQLFYVTNAHDLPNLLSRDGCYTLGEIRPCYSVETTENSSKFQGNSKVAPTQPTAHLDQSKMHGETFDHCKNEGTKMVTQTDSKKQSICRDECQVTPLTKKRVLDIWFDIFSGIGKFPREPHKFQLKPNVKPKRHAPRHVLIYLQEALHQEIRNLEQLGILEPVKEVTEWVNSFVIVEKKVPVDSSNTHSPRHSVEKKLRICLDPRSLNKAPECEPYYMRSIEEILRKFHGMTWIKIADFNKGCWIMELYPVSSKLTTMSLDIGRFQWTRLPLGSIVAQDVFPRKLDAIFLSARCHRNCWWHDHIWKTDQEYDGNLLNLLEVCRKNNLTLSLEKMKFRLPKVSFFRHTWSDKGLSADPMKIEAVKRMKLPQDVETMRSFLGLINYLNRFSPYLAESSDPLIEICQLIMEFKLNKACEVAFQCCKEEISKNITLPYYNPKTSMILQTDASKKGSCTSTEFQTSDVCI